MTHQPGVYVPLKALFLVTFYNVYLSIRISFSMHFVILVTPTFHFIKTSKYYFLWPFYDYITVDWY